MVFVVLIWILSLSTVFFGVHSCQEHLNDDHLVISFGSEFKFSGIGPYQDLSLFTAELRPTIKYGKAEDETLYTILMLDPDAPPYNNPVASDWLHWGYVDIPGKELKNGFDEKTTRGYQFIDYSRPTPPPGTGRHRYQFVLLRQPRKINEKIDILTRSRRANFDRKNFEEKFNLTCVAQAQFTTENV